MNAPKRQARIATELGSQLFFSRLEGSDGLSQNGEYRVTVLSKRGDIKAAELLGKPVSVVVKTPRGSEREFNGLATALYRTGIAGRYHQYLIVVRPWTWMLTRTSDCRIFQGKTTEQILKDIFADHPYADFRFELRASYQPWDYCVQYRETDFNFIARLLEEQGMHFFFDHQRGRHQLVVSDGGHSHLTVQKYDELSFLEPEVSSARREEGIRSWSQGCEIQPTRYALRDYDYEKPRADQNAVAYASNMPGHDHEALLELYDYPGGYAERSAGQNLAHARIESLRQQYETYQGEGNVAGLAPGCLFRLKSHPLHDQNQEYLVTSADYLLQEGEYESDQIHAGHGELFSVRLRAIPASQEFRSICVTPKPLVQGPQTAVVVGPAGQEIYTDRYGRIKVQFHWDRDGRNDENCSCWMRVAAPWAGQNWGMVTIPRIGQEVIVEFLEGDPDRPIVTGSVYNANQMPPYPLPDQKTRSGIKSRSSPGGSASNFNELRFEDKQGAEEVYLHAERDLMAYIKNDRIESVLNEQHLTVNKDLIEKIGADHHLKVTGNQNVELGGGFSFKTGQDWQAKLGANMAADAGQAIHLKAGMTVVIEAGTQLSLKVGGSFVDIGPAGVTISGPMVKINSGGSAGSGSGASPVAPKPPKEASH